MGRGEPGPGVGPLPPNGRGEPGPGVRGTCDEAFADGRGDMGGEITPSGTGIFSARSWLADKRLEEVKAKAK